MEFEKDSSVFLLPGRFYLFIAHYHNFLQFRTRKLDVWNNEAGRGICMWRKRGSRRTEEIATHSLNGLNRLNNSKQVFSEFLILEAVLEYQ